MENGQSSIVNPQSSITKPAAALLTPRGRGAVATVRFDGDCRLIDDARPSVFRAANGRRLSEQSVNRIVFGRWGDEFTEEEVVVCRTAEGTIEIHCHGGDAAVRRVLDDLQSIGCTIGSWQQNSTRIAGLLETECIEALTRATTLRTAEMLLQQQSSLLRSALEELRTAEWTPDSLAWIRERLDGLLRWSCFGLHLSRPWDVVLAGRGNVGKSSLINMLLGYSRSIVYAEPGTTRDVVTAETAFDGWPVRLADTAGMRDDADTIESAGIRLARGRLAEADLRVLLFDTSQPPHDDDFRLLRDWPDAIRVAHKCDLDNVWTGHQTPDDALRVSSLTGEGVETLAKRLVNRLIPHVPEPDTPLPVTGRQIDLLNRARQAVILKNEADFRAALTECLG